MKKTFIIIGFICAIVAAVLASSSYSNLAIIPIIIAFSSGVFLLLLSKKDKSKPKPIQYIFILSIIALGLTIYKGVFAPSKETNADLKELQIEDTIENSEELIDTIENDTKI